MSVGQWYGLKVIFDEFKNPTVIGRKGEPLKVSKCGNGKYLGVCTSHNGKNVTLYLHRLIAEMYIPNHEGLESVNHKDGNRYNNAVENLEWVTEGQNREHAYANGLRSTRPIVPVVCVNKDGNGFWFPSITSTKKHGFNPRHVISCCSGQRKTHSNYFWRECI